MYKRWKLEAETYGIPISISGSVRHGVQVRAPDKVYRVIALCSPRLTFADHVDLTAVCMCTRASDADSHIYMYSKLLECK